MSGYTRGKEAIRAGFAEYAVRAGRVGIETI